MRKTWAISGVDLHLELPGHRVRAGLEAALREAVQTGRLLPGTRLPSSRTLAADLGIARNTVAEAYGQLVAEGWLSAQQGSGTRVAGVGGAAPVPAASTEPSPGRQRARYDLQPGLPDLSAFPRAGWLSAARKALSAAPSRALGYGDPRGHPALRAALASYLARARGVRADPDRVVVCSGFTQGLALLSQVLPDIGVTRIAVEDYGLPESVSVLTAAGLVPAMLGVDDSGAVLDPAPDAAAMLLTPAHQFPIGSVLSPRRRADAARWAARSGGLIVEDDYDGEFRYDRQPVGALQALAPEHVVYAGTASKTLAPGLRIGWLVLPGRLAGPVADAKARADAHTSSFEQLTLAEFITSGAYDRHIRRARLTYRRRRDRLVAALARDAPGVRLTGIAAGLHAVAELPAGQAEEDVVARAAARGLALHGLGRYALREHTHGAALVVGYAAPPDHGYSTALTRLTAALRDLAGPAGGEWPTDFHPKWHLLMGRLPPSVGFMTATEHSTAATATATAGPQIPVRLDFDTHAAGFARAMTQLDRAATKELDAAGIDPLLRELIRVRASQLNGCAYCIDMHTKDARAAGEAEQRLYALPAWRETPFFTQRERAALAFTEDVTLMAGEHVPDAAYDAVAAHFAPREVAALLALVVTINAWNALGVTARAWTPGSYQP
ncbi:MAG TPA: aminotransferase class I/II-fold pyridoxal phosphate-dependent enzyme [Trebonia sp.]|nr:aminotransferase class I/II-fold pyridoxal phosphate-dependent enzyme [Trebonia sp.]